MLYDVTGFTQSGHSISVATNCMGSLPLHWATLSEVCEEDQLTTHHARRIRLPALLPRLCRACPWHVRRPPASAPRQIHNLVYYYAGKGLGLSLYVPSIVGPYRIPDFHAAALPHLASQARSAVAPR